MSATVLLQMDMEDDAAEKRIQITLENVTSYVTSPSDLVAGTSSLQEPRSPPLQRDQCLLQFSWSWHSNLEKACGHRVSSWQVNRRHGASSTFSAACQVTRHSKESSFRTFQTRCWKCWKTQYLGYFSSCALSELLTLLHHLRCRHAAWWMALPWILSSCRQRIDGVNSRNFSYSTV